MLERRRSEPLGTSLWVLGFMGSAVFGEISALSALLQHRDEPEIVDSVILLAIFYGLLLIALQPMLPRLTSIRLWRPFALLFELVVLAFIVITLLVAAGVVNDRVLQIFAASVLLALIVSGRGFQLRQQGKSARNDRREDDVDPRTASRVRRYSEGVRLLRVAPWQERKRAACVRVRRPQRAANTSALVRAVARFQARSRQRRASRCRRRSQRGRHTASSTRPGIGGSATNKAGRNAPAACNGGDDRRRVPGASQSRLTRLYPLLAPRVRRFGVARGRRRYALDQRNPAADQFPLAVA